MSDSAALDRSRREEVILITGISGSGKSVALHALEDAGYFCVDNLPPELLRDFIRLEGERFTHHVAVAVDVRTATSLPGLVPLIDELRGEGVRIRPIFLDASTDALVRRFSETRRRHPLTAGPERGDAARALIEGAGFRMIAVDDLTAAWGEILRQRLVMFTEMREEAARAGTPAGHDAFYQSYVRFVALVTDAALGGGRFTAIKP